MVRWFFFDLGGIEIVKSLCVLIVCKNIVRVCLLLDGIYFLKVFD